MTYQYYKKVHPDGNLLGLVRVYRTRVDHYEGKEIWNGNWEGAGQAYMDITGMGGGWYLYSEVGVEKVEEIKREIDAEYKKRKLFAYATRKSLAQS